jgi:Flp pilus assembly protein TadG
VLLLFAAGLAGFCGLVGMAIDVGQVVFARTDLQKIADASALAGSQDLPGSTSAATTSANTYASKNGSASIGVTFGNSNTTITVKATRHVDYTFLKVIGLSGTDVSAKATAKATQTTITGYKWANAAPFVIWGGKQNKKIPADSGCSFHTCVGKSYTFMDVSWKKQSGDPAGPDWNVDDPSNNFKGDVNHGDGAPFNNIGDFFSDGGLGSVTVPPVGSIITIPIVDKASGGANMRTFHIAAWVVLKVDAGCTKQHCTGTVQPQSATAPDGWVGGGSVAPPPDLAYTGTTTSLTQ